MSVTLRSQLIPIPLDLKKELPDPLIPWQISGALFKEMHVDQSQKLYRKVLVLPTHPEWRFLWRYFHHDKPTKYALKRAYCVHDRHQTQAFELNLSSIEREAEKFKANWQSEPRADQRAIAIERWKQATSAFSPLQSIEDDQRRRTWQQTKVLPLWHGSNPEKCDSICNSGFVYFGKTSLGGDQLQKSTDEGYFGSGIYFTNSARYAADIYSQGHLLLAWVAMREPFPVVGDEQQSDMKVLRGQGAYKHYNAHYVPVSPVSPHSDCAVYYPCQKGQEPTCDEIVVFQKSQTVARFWIELEVEVPYLMTPSNIPLFVSELIPHLLKILQNSHVDRDLKLRNLLTQELAILLKLKEDDDLEQRHNTLFLQMATLIDTTGNVNKAARQALTDSSFTASSSSATTSSLTPARLPIPMDVQSSSPKQLASQPLSTTSDKVELTPAKTSQSSTSKAEFIFTEKKELTSVLTLEGHTDCISFLIELKDGTLASCSADKTIKLWDRRGNCLHTLIGHTKSILSLIELKDGTLATRTYSDIKLWDRKGNCLHTLEEQTGFIYSFIELKDGTLATSSSTNIKLWDRKGHCLLTFQGHPDSVYSLIELKDGTLASCSADKTIKLWNRKGHCLLTLRGHTAPISSLIELKDGTLASCSADKTIRLWDRKGNCLHTLTGHTAYVSSLIELRDGTLASRSDDQTIKLWDRKGNCLFTLQGHSGNICSIIELKDDSLATCSLDDTVKLWDRKGNCLLALQGHSDSVYSLIELKDGTLASGSDDTTIKLWATSPILTTLASSSSATTSSLTPAWLPIPMDVQSSSPKQLASQPLSTTNDKVELTPNKISQLSTSKSELIFTEKKELTSVLTLKGHTMEVYLLIELKDGTLASGSVDNTIKLWDREGNCLNTLEGPTGSISSLIELKDGTLASCSADKTIRLWDRKGNCLHTLTGHTATVASLIELKDGTLASSSWDNTIKLWDRKGNCLHTLTGHTGLIYSLIELKDGTLASCSSDKMVKLWDCRGNCLITFRGYTEYVIELKDGTLACCSHNKAIKLWDRRGNCLNTIKGHTSGISCLVELKDSILASCSYDKTIKLWDRKGNCLLTLQGHTDSVYSLIELKDGTLASRSSDNTIKLWDRNGNCLNTFQEHTDFISFLTELKDGTLTSCSRDKTIKLWTFSST